VCVVADVWAKRKSFPEVKTDVPGLAAKGEQPPHVQKALTLEMIQERYPHRTWTHVYTDGSAENAVRNGGSGVYIRHPNGTTTALSIPVGDLSSNYRAELHALIAAVQHLTEEGCSQQYLVLLTDSLSALQSLMSGPTDLPTRQLHICLTTLSQHNKVALQWIPAHVGIAGNEEADRLAKRGAGLPQPHNSTSYKEAKTLLNRKKKSEWKDRNKGYKPQEDPINELDRRSQTTIFRLRTGHCGLRKHLKRLGLADDAHCECGSDEQTPEHILQTCPHLETVRQEYWQEETSVGTKLWGSADDLRKTAGFLATTGLRI
jgi:ribonuclease HI